MMNKDDARIVAEVYRKLTTSETSDWDDLDDYLAMLDFLDDDQLHREADVLYEKHKLNQHKCSSTHIKNEECIVPKIIDSVKAILDLYKNTGNLHPKNRYILQYYLALTQAQLITD